MSAGESAAFEETTPRRWRFGWCEYIEVNRQLLVRGKAVKMEAKPLDVLQVLLERPKQVLSKDELIGAAWTVPTSDESLATAIRKLRKAFGGERDAIILNVSGIGYRMAVPVVCAPDTETQAPPFHLNPGDPIPGAAHWTAVRPLGWQRPPLVWLCEHKTRETHVFKFATDGVRLRALQREVMISRLLQKQVGGDDRFVRVLDWQLEQAPFFIEAEYCGLNLLEWSMSEEFSRLSLEQRVELVAEIAEAVASAHSIGILHNDLKPGNVLVLGYPGEDHDGKSDTEGRANGWQIKVADFGIATLSEPQRLRELQITYHASIEGQADDRLGALVGSAMYRAPELSAGATPSVLGDVYALGVMLYQVVCGDFLEPPSPGWQTRIPDALLQDDIADAANVDPKLRMSSASELAQRLRTMKARRAEQQEREQARASARRAEEALAAARLRLPWLVLAVGALCLGLCASFWFYQRAARARDTAQRQAATLTGMYSFLAEDLLSQSNPLAAIRGQQSQETLLQAIKAALPQIDYRFHDEPEIAGRLHETIADALGNRTQFPEADAQYTIAADYFRKAQGALSQEAVIAELKRSSLEVRSMVAGSLDKAKSGFGEDRRIIQSIQNPEPELRAWAALTEAALLANGPHPEQGLPVLKSAIAMAEKTPGVSLPIRLLLKQRICFVYIRMGNAPAAETATRDLIATIKKTEGASSPALLFPELNLEEALVIGGKFKDAVEQANVVYPKMVAQLGASNQFTLQALATRAAAEGELKDYDASIRDELAVYRAALGNPSGQMFQIGTLDDAATSECRVGRYASGIEHARQALTQSRGIPGTGAALVGGSAFAVAECLLSKDENEGARPASVKAGEIEGLLKSVDVDAVAHFSGNAGFAGNVDVAEARLALMEGRYDTAQQWVDKARPFFSGPNFDAYEKSVLDRVIAGLANRARLN